MYTSFYNKLRTCNSLGCFSNSYQTLPLLSRYKRENSFWRENSRQRSAKIKKNGLTTALREAKAMEAGEALKQTFRDLKAEF